MPGWICEAGSEVCNGPETGLNVGGSEDFAEDLEPEVAGTVSGGHPAHPEFVSHPLGHFADFVAFVREEMEATLYKADVSTQIGPGFTGNRLDETVRATHDQGRTLFSL